jgi:hypothetical protein
MCGSSRSPVGDFFVHQLPRIDKSRCGALMITGFDPARSSSASCASQLAGIAASARARGVLSEIAPSELQHSRQGLPDRRK